MSNMEWLSIIVVGILIVESFILIGGILHITISERTGRHGSRDMS